MSDLNLLESQLEHAARIVDAVRGRALPRRYGVIALEAALTESMLWRYADRATTGEGDVDVWTAALLAAIDHQDLDAMTNWQAAQAVRGSPFTDGSTYRVNDAWAARIVDQLWPEPDAAAASPAAPAGSAAPASR